MPSNINELRGGSESWPASLPTSAQAEKAKQQEFHGSLFSLHPWGGLRSWQDLFLPTGRTISRI
jgi:hypothetical protein